MPPEKTVFNCRLCGDCCRGEGGIFIRPDQAEGPARIMGLQTREFIERYTEPRHGFLSIKTDAEGWCLLHDRQKHFCLIHEHKPPMCRDWPFFHGPLTRRTAFVDAKAACPGLREDATWEEFKEEHRITFGEAPPATYIFDDQK